VEIILRRTRWQDVYVCSVTNARQEKEKSKENKEGRKGKLEERNEQTDKSIC
jgi:hypothetical protein